MQIWSMRRAAVREDAGKPTAARPSRLQEAPRGLQPRMGLILPSVSYSHFTASARNLSEGGKWAHEDEAGMRDSMEQNPCKQESTLWRSRIVGISPFCIKGSTFYTKLHHLSPSQQPQ